MFDSRVLQCIVCLARFLPLHIGDFQKGQGTAMREENGMKARNLMQADLVTATPDMSLAQGHRLMHDKGIRQMPFQPQV